MLSVKQCQEYVRVLGHGINDLLDEYRISELPVDIQEAAENYLRYRDELWSILYPEYYEDSDSNTRKEIE